jgi:hypothetical protein
MKKISLKLYRRHDWLWIAVAVIVGGVCLLVLTRQDKVTKANFDRIKGGMTLEEVEDMLGPGSDERSHWERTSGWHVNGIGPGPNLKWKYWDGDEGSIDVAFAQQPWHNPSKLTVHKKEWRPAVPISLSVRIKEWLKKLGL